MSCKQKREGNIEMRLLLTSVSLLFVLLIQNTAIADDFGMLGFLEFEPNNTAETAMILEKQVVSGDVGIELDEDWYVLSIDPGEYLVSLNVDTVADGVGMEILSLTEATLYSEDTTTQDSVTLSLTGREFIHLWGIDGPSYYMLVIRPSANENWSYDDIIGTSLDFVEWLWVNQCQGPDEIEPNDDLSIGTPIDGNEIIGYACPGEFDYFKLSSPEPVESIITLNYEDWRCDIDLDFYNDIGDMIFLGDSTSPDMGVVTLTDNSYILVYASTYEGPYRITINPAGEYLEKQQAITEDILEYLEISFIPDDPWFLTPGERPFLESFEVDGSTIRILLSESTEPATGETIGRKILSAFSQACESNDFIQQAYHCEVYISILIDGEYGREKAIDLTMTELETTVSFVE